MTPRPKLLFRYRVWNSVLRRDENGEVTERNYTKESLRDGTFYFSSPRDFDDVHDSFLGPHATGSNFDIERLILHHKEMFTLMRERGVGSITQLGALKDEAAQKALAPLAGHERRRHSRVLCFAEEMDNELMWATYANYHRGICMGFDTSDSFFADVLPVRYLDTPQAEASPQSIPGNGVDSWSLLKSNPWEFQKEWRLVLPGDEPKCVSFPRHALKAIVLGYRFSERDFEELKTVLTLAGYQVQIFRIERVQGSFELGTIQVGEIADNNSRKR